jgi:hypothetical protein
MRRWLTILLLFLLPFQLSWAASAAYCQHERDAQGGHWGHHEHQDAPEAARLLDRAPNDVGRLPGTAAADGAWRGVGQAQQAVVEAERGPGVAPLLRQARLTAAASARYVSHIADVPWRPVRSLAL